MRGQVQVRAAARQVTALAQALKHHDVSELDREVFAHELQTVDREMSQVLKQIEPMRKLLEARERLVDLLAKLDGNEQLDNLLQDVIKDDRGLEGIKSAIEKTPEK